MDKKVLIGIVELMAQGKLAPLGATVLPEAKKGEKFETYLKRSFNEFEEKAGQVADIADSCNDPIQNASAKLAVRMAIVENYCKVNDPFEIEQPEGESEEEILKRAGVTNPQALKDAMEEEAYQAFVNSYRKKSKGLTKTQIAEQRVEHYAQYEPAYPVERKHNHGKGGTTRGWHFDGELQDQFVKDHLDFIERYEIEESWNVDYSYYLPEPETETESEGSGSNEEE